MCIYIYIYIYMYTNMNLKGSLARQASLVHNRSFQPAALAVSSSACPLGCFYYYYYYY